MTYFDIKHIMNKKSPYLVFLSIFLFLSITSASDWQKFGGDNSAYTQSQINSVFGLFNTSNSNLNISQGYTATAQSNGASQDTPATRTPYQPLISQIVPSENAMYAFMCNGNFLQAYSSSLSLVDEKNIGACISQIDLTDYDGNGIVNDLVTLSDFNGTMVQFNVYRFDGNHTFITTNSTNIIVQAVHNTAGARCVSGECYFIISNQTSSGNWSNMFYHVNKTSLSNFSIAFTSFPFAQPPAIQDINGDGITDFVARTPKSVYAKSITNSPIFSFNTTATIGNYIMDAYPVHPDSSTTWKIAIMEVTAGSYTLTLYKPDGSSYWSDAESNAGQTYAKFAVIDDWLGDGDGFPDIMVASVDTHFTTSYINNLKFRVYKGSNGNTLATKDFSNNFNWSDDFLSGVPSLTTAKLDTSLYPTFAFSDKRGVFVYDIFNDRVLINQTTIQANGDRYTSCVPADFNFDSYQEILCTGTSKTDFYYVNVSNANPTISSVAFDPSTTVQTAQSLNVLITASDAENNPIKYSIRCFASDNFTDPTASSTQTCEYAVAGIYNLTVAVRDDYHSTYNYFSQLITVTESGSICNNNAICESGLGETTLTCPSDCSSVNTSSSSTVEGGLTLPTSLVDNSDTNKGILPEIYYGLVGFFSYAGLPLIIFFSGIFVVLIVIATFGMVKRIIIKTAQ